MIVTFADDETADLFHGAVAGRVDILRALDLLNAAHSLEEVRAAVGPALVAIARRDLGWQKIRIPRRGWVVFRWAAGASHEVGFRRRVGR